MTTTKLLCALKDCTTLMKLAVLTNLHFQPNARRKGYASDVRSLLRLMQLVLTDRLQNLTEDEEQIRQTLTHWSTIVTGHFLATLSALLLSLLQSKTDCPISGVFGAGKTREAAAIIAGLITLDPSLKMLPQRPLQSISSYSVYQLGLRSKSEGLLDLWPLVMWLEDHRQTPEINSCKVVLPKTLVRALSPRRQLEQSPTKHFGLFRMSQARTIALEMFKALHIAPSHRKMPHVLWTDSMNLVWNLLMGGRMGRYTGFPDTLVFDQRIDLRGFLAGSFAGLSTPTFVMENCETTHERCGPFSLVVLSQRRGRVTTSSGPTLSETLSSKTLQVS